MTTWTYILTVALAAAFVLLVVGLVITILYYRWRLRDSHRTLARFIRESLEMENDRENQKKHKQPITCTEKYYLKQWARWR